MPMYFCMYFQAILHDLFSAGREQRQLAQLQTLLSPLFKWFELGTQLGIYYHELKKIELQEHGHIDHCRAAVLQRWMQEEDDVQECGGATMEQLVSTLREMEEIALVEVVVHAIAEGKL